MKRLAFFSVALLVVLAAGWSGRGVGAQDDSEATTSTLRTEVAGLKATVQARGEKINGRRTRVAEPRGEAAVATPVMRAFELEGIHDVKIYQQFVAGVYSVEARCKFDDMQVYVHDAAHGTMAQLVRRSALGEDGDLRADLPVDGEYKVEINCAGRWQVTFALSV